jgi:hypothetical protein
VRRTRCQLPGSSPGAWLVNACPQRHSTDTRHPRSHSAKLATTSRFTSTPDAYARLKTATRARDATPQRTARSSTTGKTSTSSASHPSGISSHSAELQRSAADSTGVTHPLLSDPELQIAGALGLPTFSEDAADWYCRLTLVAVSGRIVHAVYPIRRIGLSAWDVLSWLRKDGRRYTSDA